MARGPRGLGEPGRGVGLRLQGVCNLGVAPLTGKDPDAGKD